MSEANLRNAAILIRSLDYTTARRVLKSLRPETAARLSRLSAEMGRVSSAEMRKAISNFRALSAPAEGEALMTSARSETESVPDSTGSDLLPVGFGVTPGSTDHDLSTTNFETGGPFESELLAETLERERPQVVAAVLAKKRPAEAAEVLQGLCEDLRAEVLQRIAKIPAVNAEVCQLIAEEIGRGVELHRERRKRRDAGQAAVDAILAAQSSDSNEEPVETLAEPRSVTITFAEFHHLDDPSLLAVLNHAEPQVIQVAMLDLPETLAARIKRLSPHADLKHVTQTPLLLGDIERAQSKLATLASQLAESGVIVLATSKRLSAAA